ncbi:hypothetical protein ADH76_18285 [Enterocloster clostridioformis]|nr:hypothetical protein A4V08_35730 [Lachnoclostridium sp. YL32]OXE67876.1 hypothetical protein ADH76_18285 [Enterocloster clostridioformis]
MENSLPCGLFRCHLVLLSSKAHHSLDIKPEILIHMREAFRNLKVDGKLHHGSGTFNYGDWGVWL